MTQLERLTVRIDAETAGLNRELVTTARGVTSVGVASGKSHISMGLLNRELLTVARNATNTHPVVGQLVNMLGQMTLGSAVMVGVLGAGAAMGLMWEHLQKGAKEYEEALKGVAKRLDDLVNKGVMGGQLLAFQDKITALTEIGDIERKMKAAQTRITGLESVSAAIPGAGGRARQAAESQRELDLLTGQLNKWKGRLEAAEEALRGAIPSIEGITVTAKGLDERLAGYAKRLAQIEGSVREGARGGEMLGRWHVPGLGTGPTDSVRPVGDLGVGDMLARARSLDLQPIAQQAGALRSNLIGASDSVETLSDGVISFASIGGSALADFATGAEVSFHQFGEAALAELSRILSKIIAIQALKTIFAGSTGGIGAAVLAAIEPRAMGGPVMAGRPYLVGERGPELFVPAAAGAIATAGGGNGGWAAAAAALGPLPRPMTPSEVSRDAWYREFIRLAISDHSERS